MPTRADAETRRPQSADVKNWLCFDSAFAKQRQALYWRVLPDVHNAGRVNPPTSPHLLNVAGLSVGQRTLGIRSLVGIATSARLLRQQEQDGNRLMSVADFRLVEASGPFLATLLLKISIGSALPGLRSRNP
jgi:hypothetical protein